jgi:trk system potassium uptake protein
MLLRKYIFFSPGRTVLFTIFLAICFGSLLLMHSSAQRVPIAPIDCFFTATSATCVTGVLTIPFDSFTFTGKLIILALIQIGGIGLLTLSIFLVSLFVNIGLATQFMVGQVLELEVWKNTRHVLFFIIALTLVVESLGAIALYFIIAPQYSHSEALFHAIFHSISSFCNAGLSSFEHSMITFQYNIPMLAVTAFLVFSGGFGFMTWYELLIYLSKKLRGKRYAFSLTTRVVVSITSFTILAATFLLLILEGPPHFSKAPWPITISNMLFNAISYRSAGLTTIDLATMHTATVFMIIMYSFIGSSPGSTGSGIKVTTFGIYLATIRSVMRGRMVVELKGRQIPQDQVFKAMAVLSLSLFWIIASTFCLLLTENKSSFISIFFEAVSSFTNLGLATEITPYLSTIGKCIIIANMFIGRVGSLTMLLALRARRERLGFHYPEERLMMS